MSEELLWNIGFTLALVGFIIALVAVVLIFLKSGAKDGKSESKAKGGGIVIIGPIPIIFGTDKQSVKILLILSIILMILVLIWMVFNYRIF